jgi:hypothetical protein
VKKVSAKGRRALQKFDSAKLQDSLAHSPHDVICFLEAFKDLVASQGKGGPSKLISMKIPEALLVAFRAEAQAVGKPYQSLIKELMWSWLRAQSERR